MLDLGLPASCSPPRGYNHGVMVPIVALFISATFESFRFHPLLWVGVAVSVVAGVALAFSAALLGVSRSLQTLRR